MAQAGGLEAAQMDLFKAVQRPGREECLAAIRATLEAAAADAAAKAAAQARLATATTTDGCGDTLLHRLVQWNPDPATVTAAVQTLVAAGADVKAKADDGCEPLHCTALNVNAEAAAAAAIRELMAAGADVRARNRNGAEPLHYAACNNNAEAAAAAVQALVEAGADVRAKDDYGCEPLHEVISDVEDDKAAAAAIQALLAAGADVLARDNDGTTPLHLALQHSRMNAAAAIVRAGPAGAVLKDLCRADLAIAHQLFPEFVASHVPLTTRQWAFIPTACPGLGRALSTALASSDGQASQLVVRLPPADSERLRTFALCVARRQHHPDPPSWPHYLPPAVVKRILSHFDA